MPRFNSEAGRMLVTLDPNGGYLYVGNQGGAAGYRRSASASGSLNTIFYL